MTDGTPQHPGSRQSNGDDPSKLTTALVDRAIGSFREVMETRLAGMDRATELVAIDLSQTRADTDVAQRRLLGALTGDLNALRELLTARLEATDKAVGRVPSDTDRSVGALRELLGARIDGMDTATKLLAANVAEFPSDLDKAVRALREILTGDIRNVQDVATQKFEAIEGTFASNALALTAALAAQKEAAAEQNKSNTLAINKSEQATKEASAANVAQTTSSLGSQAATIADLKDRLVRLESGGVATATARTEQRAERSNALTSVQAVIMGVAIMISLISVIAFVLKK
jgi:hypothetical protein